MPYVILIVVIVADRQQATSQEERDFVAAPVGHIICALALLNSGTVKISDPNAFFAGTSFPDIRYITNIDRKVTHQLKNDSLSYVVKADSSFEIGRRFHVFVDHEREKHMRQHDAYRFVEAGPLSTHMLKLVEDNILFEKLKGRFKAEEVFGHIYSEELAYGVNKSALQTWHQILKSYLDVTRWFNISRYYQALSAYKQAFGMPDRFFKDMWTGVKTVGFLLYAYIQVERLSRDEELRKIVLDFYGTKIENIVAKPEN